MKLIIPLVSLATATAPAQSAEECCKLNLLTGEGVSIGSFIFPELNYQATGGSATTAPESLTVGHHDPDRHGVTQQLELALGVRLAPGIRLFGNYSVKIDLDDRWSDEFEEYYATFRLAGGTTLRAGRFFPRFGMHNTEHHHSTFFVDEFLANGRLVGEDHLALYGGEIALPVVRSLPVRWDDRLTLAFGAIPVDRPEEHAHGEEEPPFEAESALFHDWAAVADYTLSFAADKSTRYEGGVSGAWGNNQAGRLTQLYALHFEYLWRPEGADCDACGTANAGEFFRWRTEAMLRHFGTISEAGEDEVVEAPGEPEVSVPVSTREIVGFRPFANGAFVPIYRTSTEKRVVQPATPARKTVIKGEPASREQFTQAGFNTALSYGFPGGKVQAHLRAEYISATPETDEAERWRVSPAVAWRPSADLPIHFKLQYNYDHSPSFGDEHSVWAQFSLTWGDCCAHE